MERTDPFSEDWEWTNGERVSYTNWDRYEPTSCCGWPYGGDCVIYNRDMKWEDADCHDRNTGVLCMRGDPVAGRKKRDTQSNIHLLQRKHKRSFSKYRRTFPMSKDTLKQNEKKNQTIQIRNTAVVNHDLSLIRRKKNVYYDYGVPRPKRNVDNLVTREINCVSIWDGIAGVWSYPYTVPEYCFSEVS